MTELSNQPDDDAIVAVSLSRIRSAQEAAASGHASLRSIMGHAAEKGVHLKAAKRALAIVKNGDADKWLEENSAVTRYLRILRHGITTTQLEMFEVESTLAPIDEKAGLDGRAAGLDGKEESDNPHEIGTIAGQAWLTAYRQGYSERELILSMAMDEEGAENEEGED